MNIKVRLTKFKSKNPLTKQFKLEAGKIAKESSWPLSSGTAEVITCDFAELPGILQACTAYEALCYGTPIPALGDKLKITTEDREDLASKMISRSEKNFAFRPEQTIFYIDHDASKWSKTITPDKLYKVLCAIHPMFKGAAHIVRGSLSADVHLTGKKPAKGKSFHMYFVVKDGTDLPRFTKVLAKHLWLQGYGHIMITSNGNMLSRCVIDTCVTQGSRIDYTGAPVIVGSGLTYTPSKIKYVPGTALDTLSLPNLNRAEESHYAALVTQARAALEGKAEQIKEQWLRNREAECIKRGMSKDEAQSAARKYHEMGESGVLFGDYLLHFNKQGQATVREVVTNHNKYENQYLIDPREGPGYYATSARFRFNNGAPNIVTWGHGGNGEVRWDLYAEDPDAPAEADEELIDRTINAMQDDPDAWQDPEFLDELLYLQDEDASQFEAVLHRLKPFRIKTALMKALKERADEQEEEALAAGNDLDADDQPGETWRRELRELIADMNSDYAVVLIGNKTRIMQELWDGGRYVKSYIAPYDFHQLFKSKFIQTGIKAGAGGLLMPVMKTYSDAWMAHHDCRVYRRGVVFAPGQDVPEGQLNTWEGLSVDMNLPAVSLKELKWHIENILCDNDPELIEYFYNWSAYTFQHLDKPAGAALVFKGKKGCGKGIIGNFFCSIWGRHSFHATNSRHLTGNFNAHLADCCFLFADEAFFAGDRTHEKVLQTMITEPTIPIERKGVDVDERKNYLKIMMATNDDWVVPATEDERRYGVFLVSDAKRGDHAYFNKLAKTCKDPAVQATFINEMLERDISGFHTGMIPESIGLQEQRGQSLLPEARWLKDCLYRGSWSDVIPGSVAEFRTDIIGDALYNLYLDCMHRWKVGEYKILSGCAFGKWMNNIFGKKHKTSRNGKKDFRDLAHARQCFEEFYKTPVDNVTPIKVAKKRTKNSKAHTNCTRC
jgi:hypothetical protein